MNVPIIRLEIAGMQHTVQVALQEYAAKMDTDINAALASAMTPARIAAVIDTEAKKAIERCIAEEIVRFFTCNGDGQKFIRRQVDKLLRDRVNAMEGGLL